MNDTDAKKMIDAQIRDALTWINSPEFILNGIREILKEDADG